MQMDYFIKLLMKKANQALADQLNAHAPQYDQYGNIVTLNSDNLLSYRTSNEINAWQHAYIAGLLTIKTHSKQFSALFGYIKEVFTITEWSLDTLRDLYNNAKGIELATTCATKEEYAEALFREQYETASDKVPGTIKTSPPFLIISPDTDERANLSVLINDFCSTIKDATYLSTGGVCGKIFAIYLQANLAAPIIYDPLLVDLNGDGIKTTNIDNGVYFDHQKDGFAETSAWVDENDGVLAIDKNGDGIINDGSEVFGDNYVKSNGKKASSGFDALRDLDSNNDGVINSSDANFGLIKILKGNGELISLEEAGIVSINLNSTTKNTVDENGNTLVSSGTFVRDDGSIGNLGDFNLVVDKMHSIGVEWLDETEDVAALPDVMGFGRVYRFVFGTMSINRFRKRNKSWKKVV